ncbi:uncharacterized protein LOC126676130 [Mercurialis annua]|uniref:uncharacterized protein LOC126676130 n=1 Tax=Mercurialis annua TaxID=3986 RepID=UPI00215EAA54|nr:uncharacterized protein LOC126676130 [Mercurialis annua]
MEWTYKGKSLIELVFSWSLQDVLDQRLFEDKVRRIPKTFSSVSHYMYSFIFPLIEETRSEMNSKLTMVSLAPACEILSIEPLRNLKASDGLIYNVVLENKIGAEEEVEMYEPEPGDLIAFADVRPEGVDDLDKPKGSYLIALVQRIKGRFENGDYHVQIKASRPIKCEEGMQEVKRSKSLFAVYLFNMMTNIRIWKALNSKQNQGNMNIIMQLLQTDSSAMENCALCFSQEKYTVDISALGAAIRSFDLNESQEEAVLSCIAMRECYHQNKVKLIWGPPGTGKTKTVASLLFALLKRKCKTLTCAPTNVAILEVTTRLMSLVMPSLEYQTYGLGDIVLYGNGERMKIDNRDDLLDVFLDYRAHVLATCLAPMSGWNHYLELMICLLENPDKLYWEYLKTQEETDDKEDEKFEEQEKGNLGHEKLRSNEEKEEGKNSHNTRTQNNNFWRRIISQTLEENKKKWKEELQSRKECQHNHYKTAEKLTFNEFLKNKFLSCLDQMKMHILNMYTHLPTSVLPKRIVKRMVESVELLELLENLLSASNEGFKQALGISEDDTMTVCAFTEQSKLSVTAKDCLEVLKWLHDAFVLRDLVNSDIKSFCLRNARLIFCTASSSFHLHKEDISRLEMLIIDEAAQLKESESTVPLLLPGIKHVVLIGDERQLPAIVRSKVSKGAEFGRSLYQRLVLLGYKRHLLNVQYRMHPSISLFPNIEFYGEVIIDATTVKETSHNKIFLPGKMYGTYSFMNVACGHDEFDGRHRHSHSMKNVVEVAVVSKLVEKLFKESAARKQKLSVGVIAPYKAQVFAIQEKFGKTFDTDSGFSVSVSSIEGFQGGEKDIIIISTVRCNSMGLVGFLSDPQRTNVALTRARHCLWIVGNGATLDNSGSVWKRLIDDAKARECFHNADEDESLVQAITVALVEANQLDELLNMDSILFRNARWKVLFDEHFLKSIAKIKSTSVCTAVLSILSKLSSGWRQPHNYRDLCVTNVVSSQLLEHYKVEMSLYLVWTVDILKENKSGVQVLRVWDILPAAGILNLAEYVAVLYKDYSADEMELCKVRQMEGNSHVPWTWSINSNNLLKDDGIGLLSLRFALLSLMDHCEASASCDSDHMESD